VNGSQLNATNLAFQALNTKVDNLAAAPAPAPAAAPAPAPAPAPAAPFKTSPDASSTPPVPSGTTSVAGGNNAVASGNNSAAVGNNALAAGAGSTALGNGAVASNANDVALGAGSTTGTPHTGVTAMVGTAAGTANNNGVVSVGSAGHERQIQNVGAGVLSATSTDAVNGSQLYSVKAGVDGLGGSAAAALGGGSTYNSNTGRVSAPTYNVYGGDVNNVGAAIDALQSKAPLQYSDANGKATPTTPSNNVTLVGADPTKPVQLHNVADGVAPTDAVNVEQLQKAMGDVNQLRNDITANRKDANAGAASAMAMANMPQAFIPGKSMFSAGMAAYDGQAAIAIGGSAVSDNGRWILRLSGSASTSGKVGVGAGAGFHW
jgi:autotransporter adhesin